jgi:hypothetical protein
MSLSAFQRSLSARGPGPRLTPALRALWWAANDDWDKAHKIVMDEDDAGCAWVHAYLHRVEGDLENARYWYRRARRKPATGSLDREWAEIAAALIKS